MTATPRRTIRIADGLWSAFLRLHGPSGASQRIRDLIAADLENQKPPREIHGAASRTEQNSSTHREGIAE